MLEDVSTLRDDLLILLHSSVSVTDAEDWEHLEEGKYLLQEGLAEDVCSGHEDRSAVHRTEDDQWVEQCACVVTSDDDSAVFGEILLASHYQSAQRQFDDGIYPEGTQQCVPEVFVVYLHDKNCEL